MSYDAHLAHHGKPVAGTAAIYKGPTLYLYELDLSADPRAVEHFSGKPRAGQPTPRRAPYRECPWWVCVGKAHAHWPGDPNRRSTGEPIG